MKTTARVSLGCPNCATTNRQDAALLLREQSATCPECDYVLHLDPRLADHALVLDRARHARIERRSRLKQMRQGWFSPVGPGPASLVTSPSTEDIWNRLEGLLHRLNQAY